MNSSDVISLSKIVSGGQTGVDQAALRAAKRLGLATGGWAPREFRTLDGPRPDLGSEFGLIEHASSGYGSRTNANVRDSDATVRIARNFFSPGEKKTLSAIIYFKKEHLDVHVDRIGQGGAVEGERLREFLKSKAVRVLNVAGNSEQTSPGIGAIAEEFLVAALAGVCR